MSRYRHDNITACTVLNSEVINMSDAVIGIFILTAGSLASAIMMHTAMGHRRLVSILVWLACIGIFVSTVGVLLLVGTFTPEMTDYSQTSGEIYNAFSWGGIELPEYDEMQQQIQTVGAIITAMGLGVLIMATLSGFFPRAFFSPVKPKDHRTIPHH